MGLRGSWFHDGAGAYGRFLARHPWPFIFVPVAVSLALGSGLRHFAMHNDLRLLYTPRSAESRLEIAQQRAFAAQPAFNGGSAHEAAVRADDAQVAFDVNDPNYVTAIITFNTVSEELNFVSRSGWERLRRFDAGLRRNFSFSFRGRMVSFWDELCVMDPGCSGGLSQMQRFLNLFWNKALHKIGSQVSFTYPVFRILGQERYVGSFLAGVDTEPKTGTITSATVVISHIRVRTETEERRALGAAWVRALMPYLVERTETDLRASGFSFSVLDEEVNRILVESMPYLGIMAVLMIIFVCINGIDIRDPVRSKFWELLGGLLSCVLSFPFAFGLMFYAGAPFNGTIVIMPFLVVAIGVDDMFILVGAWKASAREAALLKTEARIGWMMREVGAAISLTTLTDVASFTVGALCRWVSRSETPAMIWFCAYTAVAIAADFVFQVTFFPAVLTLGGRREEAQRHGVVPCLKILPWKRAPACEKGGSALSQKLLRIMRMPIVKVGALLAYGVYLGWALVGCSRMVVSLDTSKVLVDDSPLNAFIALNERYSWSEGVRTDFFATRPPDFLGASDAVCEEMLGMVRRLEGLPYSIGPGSTQIWIRDFLDYRSNIIFDDSAFYQNLQAFSNISQYRKHRASLKWVADGSVKGGYRLAAFAFHTHYHRVFGWAEKTDLLRSVRTIVGQYPQWAVSQFADQAFYTDQVITLGSTTMQTMGIALLSMAVIAVAFFPSMEAVFWVFLALLSIDLGVLGFLVHWGAELDPMIMTDVVVSVGFSIDYAAHFCYLYYRLAEGGDGAARREAGAATLSSVGLAILQCGASTLVAVLPLAFVRAHIIRFFFRTVVLVVALGLAHALCLLPLFLPALHLPPLARRFPPSL